MQCDVQVILQSDFEQTQKHSSPHYLWVLKFFRAEKIDNW